MKYVQPKVHQKSFTCPICGVLAKQEWQTRGIKFENFGNPSSNILGSATCQNCEETSIWIEDKMYFPESGNSPFPNTEMPELVKKRLPEIVQQSLDIVRVTGNDAVHPGQIDTDNPETVAQLFELTNVIIEYMIALPKKVSGIYSSLPSQKIEGIKQRDKL